MDVAQAGDDQLLGLLEAFHVKRRILFAQPGQSARDLLLVASGLGRDRQGVSGARQVERWKRPSVLQAERVAGQRVRQLGRCADVACPDLCCGDVLLSAREEDLRQPLLAATGQVGQVRVGLDRAGHDFEVADSAELVAARAEHERFHGFVRLDVRWRHQLADGGHQRPDAQQPGCRAAHHRRHLPGEDALAEAALDLLLAQRAGVQVFLEQRVITLRSRFDQLAAVLLDQLLHVVWNGHLAALAVGCGDERFEVQQVDYAPEVLLRTDRQMEWKRARREIFAQRGDRAVEIGILLVQLVDDDDSRLVGPVALLPGNLCADGKLRARAHHHDCAFGHAEPAEDLACEVEEPRCVEDVDLVAVVLGEGDAEVDRDLALVFFRLEVHGRGRLVRRAQAGDRARREQHRLSEHGLAVVGVAQEDDVSDLVRSVFSGHPPPYRPDCCSR